MNTLELLQSSGFSETQISKIQNQLDFFKSNGFKLTEEEYDKYISDGYLTTYKFRDNDNGIEISCYYTLLHSKRISSSFYVWSDRWETYVISNVKTFKEFRKNFNK
jgi:hypothetical protein